MSEFRKASPDLVGPYGGLGRNGQPSAGQRAANAMMSDFSRGGGQQTMEYSSSIQKVLPDSRERMNGDDRAAAYRNSISYSSKPHPEQVYQSMQIEQPPNNGPSSRNPTEDLGNFRDNIAQREQQFMEEERNFARGGPGEGTEQNEEADIYGSLAPVALGQDSGPIRESFDQVAGPVPAAPAPAPAA